MAKALTSIVQGQLDNQDIRVRLIFKINSVDYTSYLLNWSVNFNKSFGAATGSFVLINDGGIFGKDGAKELNVGDVVELIELYHGDNTQFKKFYGIINQRSIEKSATTRTIGLTCLDYISTLKFLDIDYEAEATKIEVSEEVLSPNYLPSPNDNMAQVFDFANEAIAQLPVPVLTIRNRNNLLEDPQYDGFDISYDIGQVKLGSPLNARYNYHLIARTYFFYPQGLYIEDIIEDIIILPDGYGKYLFNESTAQAVIDNHLTSNFRTETELTEDTLSPNTSISDITINTTISIDFDPDLSGAAPTTLYVTDTSGFPTSGEGDVNSDAFSWTGKTATTLTGIPISGNYSLKAHQSGSVVKYQNSYPIGQVWYLTYSNLLTGLAEGHFDLPSGISLQYLDKRYGRIILSSPVDTDSEVKCNTNYDFKTLQATGIQLNKLSFRSREVENRFDALKKLRSYLAPNYIIRTIGDNKIWASYLSQKTTADYTLQLATKLNYLEDTDLYTRVVFYGKNKNPTNIMYSDIIGFETTGQTYKAIATQIELSPLREEDAHWIYGSSISGVGKITSDTVQPVLFVNGTPIDNTPHEQLLIPVVVEAKITTTTKTTTEGGK